MSDSFDPRLALAEGANATGEAANAIINSEKAKTEEKSASIATGSNFDKASKELKGLQEIAKELQTLITELKKLETELASAAINSNSPDPALLTTDPSNSQTPDSQLAG